MVEHVQMRNGKPYGRRSTDYQRNYPVLFLTALTFIVGTALSLMGWWALGPVKTSYRVLEEGSHRAQIVDCTSLHLYRVFVAEKDVEFQVTRELRRQQGNVTISASLGNDNLAYPKGQHRIQYQLHVPEDLEPGEYTLVTRLTERVNPIRSVRIILPEVRVTLAQECKARN